MRGILWLVTSGLMTLSLAMAACAPTPTPTAPTTPTTPATPTTTPAAPVAPATEKPQQEGIKPAAESPQYGGTLNLVQTTDITVWDDIVTRTTTPGPTFSFTNDPLWGGDWSKGPAGGYGTKETDWAEYYDRFDQKIGYLAENWKWTVNAAKNEGTIIYQIRQGKRYALNREPWAEASRLAGGREVSTDDVVFSLKQMVTDRRAYIYRANPELRVAEITKTGPWEVTIKLPLDALYVGIGRFGNYGRVVPPEVVAKYGDMAKWQNSAGSGSFILTDYVPGSIAVMARNPSYWMKDPVGSGKGSQLPYLERVRYLIIPDASTRLAALRTGKLDQLTGVSTEDATQLRRTTPALLEAEGPGGGQPTISMRTDLPPFNDIRVRRALMMATDFQAINQSFYDGKGQILTWPYGYRASYADLYLSLDDPEIPASVREFYTYNPEKAKQLLKEAGYPGGLKTSALITQTEVDYYSIIKDMWAKVGIDVELDVKDRGAWQTIMARRGHQALAYYAQGPVAMWYTAITLAGEGPANASMINDPFINDALAKIRIALLTESETSGMRLYKEMMKYVLDQAYVIPGVSGSSSRFWWPWLKNYSGEFTTDFGSGNSWIRWVWLDQDMKKKMGY
ncbi:MAG: ABC transporter substrate-binding protein [Chloroflexi bacterium]|nr:ABC transporter substrate-binding protein [Chloroflexota bacterium]